MIKHCTKMSEDHSEAAVEMDVEDESPGMSRDDGSGDSVVFTGGDHDDSTGLSDPDREQEGSSVDMAVLSSRDEGVLSGFQNIASVETMDTNPSSQTAVGNVSTPMVISGGVFQSPSFGAVHHHHYYSIVNHDYGADLRSTGDDNLEATSDHDQEATSNDDQEATSDDDQEATSNDDQEATNDDDQEATSDDDQEATSDDDQEATSDHDQEATITFKRIVKSHLHLMSKVDTIFPKFEDGMLMPKMVACRSLRSGKEDHHEIELQELHKLLDNNKPDHVEITGEAGSGKTTAAKKYASLVSEGEVEALSDISLVHYVEVKNLQCDSPATAFDMIFKQQIPDLQFDEESCENGEKWVRENTQKILLIIDGLDEFPEPFMPNCPVVYSATQAKATTIVANILSHKIWPGMKIVITSRGDECSQISGSHRFERIVHMEGLSYRKVANMMRHVLNYQALEFIRYHKLDKMLYPLCSNPATLTGVAEGFMSKDDSRLFPTTLSGVVIHIVTRTFPSLFHNIIRDLVQFMKLAYRGIIDGTVFTPAEFSTWIMPPCITAYPVRGDIKIRFSHRLAQEVLAALYLFQLSRKESLEIMGTHFQEKRMEMVKRFLFGMVFNHETRSIVEQLFCGTNACKGECQEILIDWLNENILVGAVTGMKTIALLNECDSIFLIAMLGKNHEIQIDDARLSTSDVYTLLSFISKSSMESMLLDVRVESTKIDPEDIQALVQCCQKANSFDICNIHIGLANHQPTSDQFSALTALLPYAVSEISIAGWQLTDQNLTELQNSLNHLSDSKVKVHVSFESYEKIITSTRVREDNLCSISAKNWAAPPSPDEDEYYDCIGSPQREERMLDGETGDQGNEQFQGTPAKRRRISYEQSVYASHNTQQEGDSVDGELHPRTVHSGRADDPDVVRIKNACFYDEFGHIISYLWVTEQTRVKQKDQMDGYHPLQGRPILLNARRSGYVTITLQHLSQEIAYKINRKYTKHIMVDDIIQTGYRDVRLMLPPAPTEMNKQFSDRLYTIQINGCEPTEIPFRIKFNNCQGLEKRVEELEKKTGQSASVNMVYNPLSAQNLIKDSTVQPKLNNPDFNFRPNSGNG